MSDEHNDNDDEANGARRPHHHPIFGSLRMPTSQEQLEFAKKRQGTFTEALPHLKEAQISLREAAALGICSDKLDKAREHVAVMIDVLECEILRVT
jgi:hypothetical protein